MASWWSYAYRGGRGGDGGHRKFLRSLAEKKSGDGALETTTRSLARYDGSSLFVHSEIFLAKELAT